MFDYIKSSPQIFYYAFFVDGIYLFEHNKSSPKIRHCLKCFSGAFLAVSNKRVPDKYPSLKNEFFLVGAEQQTA